MPTKENTITATKTSLRIVEALKRLDGAGVTAVAKDLNMTKSTVHNHLQTLEGEGYVTNEKNIYRVGLQFLELGEYKRNRMDIYEKARPEVTALAEKTGEMANAAVEEHGEGVYITRAEGTEAVTVDTYAGKRVKLHCTALGKTILAELPKERVDEIVDAHGLPARTENTITDRAELKSELAEIRDRGYAYDREERLSGLRCVAAPVVPEDGDIVAALSVAGPTTRIKGERFHKEIPELLRSAANVIEINLVYS
ncbi:IclR family transcriptional regulator [Halorubrum lacusprofundi]|jgi:DNA-binding IclR family transcriptional regulator|uniref:IclR family transcriptional regulator n=1 Tax=Halorubrum lacusprofundi TaxID=2247 RepID=UPI000B5A9246|nr:IclR family transcriptional regulator [Halorubrum lacusprofundi]MCG1007568.1 IclR family transcriptional regulator [Halorubrum lacusprofundi]